MAWQNRNNTRYIFIKTETAYLSDKRNFVQLASDILRIFGLGNLCDGKCCGELLMRDAFQFLWEKEVLLCVHVHWFCVSFNRKTTNMSFRIVDERSIGGDGFGILWD